MIKTEKSQKFPENPWNFPEKSPKNTKNLQATGGGIFKIFNDRGFSLTPLLISGNIDLALIKLIKRYLTSTFKNHPCHRKIWKIPTPSPSAERSSAAIFKGFLGIFRESLRDFLEISGIFGFNHD